MEDSVVVVVVGLFWAVGEVGVEQERAHLVEEEAGVEAGEVQEDTLAMICFEAGAVDPSF